MASYKVEFSANVRKDFRKLSESDAERILQKIQELSGNSRAAGSKKIKGEELYRIRVRQYRVVYEIEDEQLVVFIVRVRHRKDVYRQ